MPQLPFAPASGQINTGPGLPFASPQFGMGDVLRDVAQIAGSVAARHTQQKQAEAEKKRAAELSRISTELEIAERKRIAEIEVPEDGAGYSDSVDSAIAEVFAQGTESLTDEDKQDLRTRFERRRVEYVSNAAARQAQQTAEYRQQQVFGRVVPLYTEKVRGGYDPTEAYYETEEKLRAEYGEESVVPGLLLRDISKSYLEAGRLASYDQGLQGAENWLLYLEGSSADPMFGDSPREQNLRTEMIAEAKRTVGTMQAQEVQARKRALKPVMQQVAAGYAPPEEDMIEQAIEDLPPADAAEVSRQYAVAKSEGQISAIIRGAPLSVASSVLQSAQAQLNAARESGNSAAILEAQESLNAMQAKFKAEAERRMADPASSALEAYTPAQMSLASFEASILDGDMESASKHLGNYIVGVESAYGSMGMAGETRLFPKSVADRLLMSFTTSDDLDQIVQRSAMLKEVSGDNYAKVFSSIFGQSAGGFAVALDRIESPFSASLLNAARNGDDIEKRYYQEKKTVPSAIKADRAAYQERLSEITNTIPNDVFMRSEEYVDSMNNVFIRAAMQMEMEGRAGSTDEALDMLIADFRSDYTIHEKALIDRRMLKEPDNITRRIDMLKDILPSIIRDDVQQHPTAPNDVAWEQLEAAVTPDGTAVRFLIQGNSFTPVVGRTVMKTPQGFQEVVPREFSIPLKDLENMIPIPTPRRSGQGGAASRGSSELAEARKVATDAIRSYYLTNYSMPEN